MIIRVLSAKRLQPFLKRHMQRGVTPRDLRLEAFLRIALEKANEFVPSESGSIFLDDPGPKMSRSREDNVLAAVACFGRRSKQFIGKRILATKGIAGRVYLSGQPYFSRDVRKDRHFSAEFDRQTGHKTRSVLCAPITIRHNTVGVLELVNKKGKRPYTEKDFELLKIFADYISAAIQNFLDAKRHAELSKKDDLTGLSNDRHLHAVLKKEVAHAWRQKKELGLIFLDLDRFKEVNDVHGHLAGSRVLVEVADIIRRVINWPRAEIARYGGDEYVAILPGAGVARTAELAEELRVAIERNIFLALPTPDVPALNLVDHITSSIGVACLLAHVGAADGSRLLKAADQAMYESKRAGKNHVTVAKRMAEPATTSVTH